MAGGHLKATQVLETGKEHRKEWVKEEAKEHWSKPEREKNIIYSYENVINSREIFEERENI